MTAYDEATGRQAWRFFTVPGDPAKGFEDEAMAMAAKTWSGQWWKSGGGGGTVWDNMTYDPGAQSDLYRRRKRRPMESAGSKSGRRGQSVPRLHRGVECGYREIRLALSSESGGVMGLQGNRQHDHDGPRDRRQAPEKSSCKVRPTDFFYVIDRVTGRLISAGKTGKNTWADRIDVATGRPVERPDIRYANKPLELWPSSLGTHSWHGMSFDAATGLV